MITSLLSLLLPRFVQEGKKYSTIAVGCTGGRHRSVHMVEKLAAHSLDRNRVARERDASRTGPRAGAAPTDGRHARGGFGDEPRPGKARPRPIGHRRPEDKMPIVTVGRTDCSLALCVPVAERRPMIGMILVTHGRLAEELRSAMEHVVGAQRNVDTVCIGPDDDIEGRRAEIERLYRTVRHRRWGGAADRHVRRHAVQSRDLHDGARRAWR